MSSTIGPLEEWQECRTTIARFDGFLADIRKYGFTLVTVLLTANALVTPSDRAVDRPAASIVVMALLVALFMLDNYYWSLLRGAVARARDLEATISGGGDRLTATISKRVSKSHATDLILLVYAVFVGVAFVIGLTGGVVGARAVAGWVGALVLATILAPTLMWTSFLIVQSDAPPSKWFEQHVLRMARRTRSGS